MKSAAKRFSLPTLAEPASVAPNAGIVSPSNANENENAFPRVADGTKTHKHWPKDHWHYESAPWCVFKTKTMCDAFAKTYEHGHPAVPCDMQVMWPAKVKKCVLQVKT